MNDDELQNALYQESFRRRKLDRPKDRKDNSRNYPFSKVNRWLQSKVGQPFNNVISEYTQATWLPPVHRTYHRLTERVEVTTFMHDGEVWFRGMYSWSHTLRMKDQHTKMFYVHPSTNILQFHPGRRRVRWNERRAAEDMKTLRILGDYHQLIKINGYWYEVKGEPVSDTITVNGLHYRKARTIWPTPLNVQPLIINQERYFPVEYCRPYRKPVGPRDRMIKKDDGLERSVDFSTVRIVLLRQLSHKELKQNDIRNDVYKI